MAGRRTAQRRVGLRGWTGVLALLSLLLLAPIIWVAHLIAAPNLIKLGTASAAGHKLAVIFFSGDTGLRSWSLGGRVAQQLAADGYPVTGIDALAAFSRRKTPGEVTELVQRAIEIASAGSPDGRVVLIGQSFGSDMIPLAVRGLPPELKRRIAKIILIVPGTHGYLQVSPGEIAGTAAPDLDIRPLVSTLPRVPVTCIYGVEEQDTLCPTLGRAGAEVFGLPGGHALRRDTGRVLGIVRSALAAAPS